MLKIGLRSFLCVFFLSVLNNLSAQEPVVMTGLVQGDSIQLEDIHVLNMSTRQGTITNQYGEFEIPASVNDTLIFSGIQFHTLGIVLSKEAVEKRVLRIELISKIEELTEIELKGNDLDGLFYIDTKRMRDSLPLMSDEAVNFSNQGYDDPKSSNYVVPPANLMDLISKIGSKRRLENQKEENLIQRKRMAPMNLRKDLGDEVFEQELGIPKDHIESFIRYCQKKDIIDLYVDGRMMEVIDILVKEKDKYRRERILNN